MIHPRSWYEECGLWSDFEMQRCVLIKHIVVYVQCDGLEDDVL